MIFFQLNLISWDTEIFTEIIIIFEQTKQFKIHKNIWFNFFTYVANWKCQTYLCSGPIIVLYFAYIEQGHFRLIKSLIK